MTRRDLITRPPGCAGRWSSVELGQSPCCRAPSLVRPNDFHFTAPDRERFFFISLDSLANLVRTIATNGSNGTFMDGLLWSILSSLGHSVVARRNSRKAEAVARSNAYASPFDRSEKPSRSQPRTRNRRSARGELHTCAQLIVYQKKTQVSTNEQYCVG